MNNSKLVSYVAYSPNNSGQRTMPVDRITPHCVVGQLGVKDIGALFSKTSYKASSNYGIGSDGSVGLYVDEDKRSWCSSSSANDQRSITIECASDTVHPYAMAQCVYDKLVDLCVDICQRYKKSRLIWIPNKQTALSYNPNSDEMLLTVHRWYAKKECPGEWLYSRLGALAKTVTDKLTLDSLYQDKTLYRVQIGAYRSRKLAEACVTLAKQYGFQDAFITEIKDYYT